MNHALLLMLDIVPGRILNHLYIYLDIAFLCLFMGMLIYNKRYMTALFALAGGIIYFIVDYGIFYLLLRTRVVEGASYFWFLLWLSLSYGITNFAWIWLWFRKDKHLLEWSLLIVMWWIACPIIAMTFGGSFGEITIYRGTSIYHGVMAILLFGGYLMLIIMNMLKKDGRSKINLWWLLAIGVLVQFAWEAALLVGGIRQGGIETLAVNSLLETNMGIPYLYLIYLALTKKYKEDLSVSKPA